MTWLNITETVLFVWYSFAYAVSVKEMADKENGPVAIVALLLFCFFLFLAFAEVYSR